MKTTFSILLMLFAIAAVAVAEPRGLYLRAVVEEGTGGAVRVTDEDGEAVFVSPVAIITPGDVTSAEIEDGEQVVIRFTFNSSGQVKLGKATRAMIGKKLAVIVDGRLLSTPVVRSEFSTGAAITGNFTREWAESVVERVNKDPKDRP